jgi:type I restriction enzyme S subunit
MSKEAKNMMVPRLRFPEFKESGNWEETTLGHKADYENGKAHENDISETGKYIVVNSKFISSDGTVRKFTNHGFCVADQGDILMVLSDVPNGKAIAKCFLIDANNKFTVNQRICRLKPKKAVGLLLYYIINRNQYFLAFDDGVKQTNLKNDDVLNCPILLPKELIEQQKIADCLSSLDELIKAQSQKLEALKAHKKGLMQQLFPAEDETVPQLRFAEFRDSGEWEEKTVGSLVNLQSGFAFQSMYFSNAGKKLVTPKNFTKEGYANFNQENTKFTTEIVDIKYLCTEGDLLLLLTDLTPSCELLGKPLLLNKKDGEVLLNQRIVRISSKGCIDVRFLFCFFSTEIYHMRIRDTASGSTVRHSSNGIIADTEICFPSKKEQQKIAECLSSLDELITAQAEKIEVLKVHKKGLMQGLFPQASEMRQ